MKPFLKLLFLGSFIGLPVFAGALYELDPSHKNCNLKKHVGSKWRRADVTEVQGAEFEVSPATQAGYSSFHVDGIWFFAKNECLTAVISQVSQTKTAPVAKKISPLAVPQESAQEQNLETTEGVAHEATSEIKEKDEDISALHYFTEAKKTDLIFSANLLLNQKEEITQSSLAFENHSVSGFSQTVAATYGVLKNATLTLSETFLSGQTTSITPAGVSFPQSVPASGASDPTLTAFYRFFDTPSQKWFFDLGLSLQPSLIKSRLNIYPQSGTLALGYSTAVLLPSIMYVMGTEEFEILPRVKYAASGHQSGATASTDQDSESFIAFSTLFSFREHLVSNLYFNPLMNVEWGHSEPIKIGPNLNRQINKIPLNFSPGMNVGFLITPKLLVSLEYDYSRFTIDQTQTAVTGAVTDQKNALRAELLTLQFLLTL